MSTDYRLESEVRVEQLFDGRLKLFGVHEGFPEGSTPSKSRALTDGHNFLWVYGDEVVSVIRRYGGNAPNMILNAIAEALNTAIFSEYEPKFWGCETQEEWDGILDEMHKEDQANFYLEIMDFVRGRLHGIKPGSVGMTMAEIAKRLIARNPDLATPDHEADLMEAIDRDYLENHTVEIKLTEQGIEAAKIIASHGDASQLNP